MRLLSTAALVVVALAASQCAAQTAERAPIRFTRGAEHQTESLRERKLPKDRKKKKKKHHQEETETEGTPIPEEYYKETRQQQPSCSVCGDEMKVGNPDAAVSFPGQAGQIPCGVLENMGTVGLIPPAQCAVLPQLISTVCECESINPPTTTTVATEPATTTEATEKPGQSGKSSKSDPIMSHSMSLPSKAGKSIHGKATKTHTGKSAKANTVISTKSYKSSYHLSLPSSSKGAKMIASKASAKSEKSKSGKSSSSTVDAKAEKVSSAKAAKAVTPKAAKSSSRA